MFISCQRYMGTEPSVPITFGIDHIVSVLPAAKGTGFGSLISTASEPNIPLVDEYEDVIRKMRQSGGRWAT